MADPVSSLPERRRAVMPSLRLSYEELGNLVGARVDAVGKAMKELGADGSVCLMKRHVIVRDLENLRRAAELTDVFVKDARVT